MRDAVRKALEATFFRVQDRDGRGPFKPGILDRWRDPDGADYPPVQIEFGLDWREEIPAGWHCGCAFRTIEQAARWFSPSECSRLADLGYQLVSLRARPLRESACQSIIVRPTPLRWGTVVAPWPHQASASLDPWRTAAAVEAAAREGA